MIDSYGRALQVDGAIIIPTDEAAETRAGRAEQENLQQTADISSSFAPAAKQLSETDIGGTSALEAVLGAV